LLNQFSSHRPPPPPPTSHSPTGCLRSAGSGLLFVPCPLRSSIGDRAFSLYSLKLWNSLSQSLRLAPSLPTFKSHLKTLILHRAYTYGWRNLARSELKRSRREITRRQQDFQPTLGQSKAVTAVLCVQHMREVAERRHQLEVEHEDAVTILKDKQEEVQRLQQAQFEAQKEHEGVVVLLEAKVLDLEEKCRSQSEQFCLLSRELERFRRQSGNIDVLTNSLVTSEPSVPVFSQTHHSETPAADSELPTEAVSKSEPSEELPTDTGSVFSKGAPSTQSSNKGTSKTESLHSSPKSCPTPEVDTASEVEELDIDNLSSIPDADNRTTAKLQVFIARYSYNPFDGPNENPEAELPLTAGDYIYVYGDMDEDGFYEGPPDAPLDVQVEAGPDPGVLLISWLPVTIDAAGTSNGVRVMGYAVYTAGYKVKVTQLSVYWCVGGGGERKHTLWEGINVREGKGRECAREHILEML
uniref:RIMS-binding protein 1/2/3 Fn3 domain-containing protein n=1 Tax=Callorhinchus milii TaxID=7868 RepID=A0A4W3K1Y1_CALMI